MVGLNCPSCHTSVAGGILCPHCGATLFGRPAPADPAPAAPGPPPPGKESTPARTVPAPDAAAERVCPTTWCRSPVPAGAGTCAYCGQPVPDRTERAGAGAGSGLEVGLPDGSTAVIAAGTPLVIGRSSPDPVVAAALAPLDAVSRRHLEVLVDGDVVHVTDLGSTNGSYVDGVAAEPRLTVPVGPLVLRLGKVVTLTLRPLGGEPT